MARSESRFGFGQLAGSVGAALLVLGVMQPWLTLDLEKAGDIALRANELPAETTGQILYVWSNVDPATKVASSPQLRALTEVLGVWGTGWEQQKYLSIGLLIAAFLAIVGVLRSVLAQTAWSARTNSPLLALAGLAGLGIAGVALWVLAPEPRAAMRPGTGLWLVAGGSILLLLGALTLGNNRRRPWIDDFEAQAPAKHFDNTEHLAYSHGAWVPRNPEDSR